MRSIGWVVSVASVFTAFGCTESKQDTPPPGPPPPKVGSAPPPGASAAAPGVSAHLCKDGGGQNTDAETAPFFARSLTTPEGASYCLKPDGEVLTYGEKGKLTMDEVCTTAFDGECEVYKRFQLKRVVTLSYVDDAGKGVNVEVVLSRFATPDGAYGMFTKRVVADGDPKGEGVPKPMAAGTAGAIGTGRAYLVRGAYLVELQYNSDNETPQQLTAASAQALPAIAKSLGDKLPGEAVLPASAKALPSEGLVPNGIQYLPKEMAVPGFGNVGPAAFGFYDAAGARTRVLSIVRATEAEAKATFATLKAKGKAVEGVGDEAVTLSVGGADKDAQKVDFVVARKGARIVGVGDEEFALKSGGKPQGFEALTEQAKKLVSAP